MTTNVTITGKNSSDTLKETLSEDAFICIIDGDTEHWHQTSDIDRIAEADNIVFKGNFEKLEDALRHYYGEDLSCPITYLDNQYHNNNHYAYIRKHEPWIPRAYQVKQRPTQVASIARWILKNVKAGTMKIRNFGDVVGAFDPWGKLTEPNRTIMWDNHIAFNLNEGTVWIDEKQANTARKRYLTAKKKQNASIKEWKNGKGTARKKLKVRLTVGDVWLFQSELHQLLGKFIGSNIVIKREWGQSTAAYALRAVRCYAVLGNDLFGRGWYRKTKNYQLFQEQWKNQSPSYKARFNNSDIQWLEHDFTIRLNKVNYDWAVAGRYNKGTSIFMAGVKTK